MPALSLLSVFCVQPTFSLWSILFHIFIHQHKSRRPPGTWLVTLRERLRSGAVIMDRNGWRTCQLRPARCFVWAKRVSARQQRACLPRVVELPNQTGARRLALYLAAIIRAARMAVVSNIILNSIDKVFFCLYNQIKYSADYCGSHRGRRLWWPVGRAFFFSIYM